MIQRCTYLLDGWGEEGSVQDVTEIAYMSNGEKAGTINNHGERREREEVRCSAWSMLFLSCW